MSGVEWPMRDGPVVVEELDQGQLWRVVLNTPKANIVDGDKCARLRAVFERARAAPAVKAVLLDSAGPHFSFGASVEEHLPGRCRDMLGGFHALFRRILDTPVVTLAAVRGQCLGGALELAAFSHRVFAAPGASLGQPEIQLGVFAPVASVALARRVGAGAADDLCLSGRSLGAAEALRVGLVDEVAEDPTAAALAHARQHLLGRSASSLRLAVRAARVPWADAFRRDLEVVERLYLDELMATRDAVEGLEAFLDKRPPRWSNA